MQEIPIESLNLPPGTTFPVSLTRDGKEVGIVSMKEQDDARRKVSLQLASAIADEIAAEAEKRGMTPEIAAELLKDI